MTYKLSAGVRDTQVSTILEFIGAQARYAAALRNKTLLLSVDTAEEMNDAVDALSAALGRPSVTAFRWINISQE